MKHEQLLELVDEYGIDPIIMTSQEFEFIINKSGITYTELGKNAQFVMPLRNKPYTNSAIYYWRWYQNGEMKGYQIELLKHTVGPESFLRYRVQWFEQQRALEEYYKKIEEEKTIDKKK